MLNKYDSEELNLLQQKLSQQLDFSPPSLYKPKRDDIIVTIDVLYSKEIAKVGIDITTWPHQPVKTVTYQAKVSGQYIPGYFSFYEGPVILETLDWLKEQGIIPAVVVVDGHGIAIRLQENKAPVFISPGNKISLETAIAVIKQMTSDFKFPDNIRRADQASRL